MGTRPRAAGGLLAGAFGLVLLSGAAAGGTTTVVATTTTTAVPATTTTPQSVLNRALAAAKTEPTVHFVASSTVGKRTYTVSGDAAAKTGAQDITLRDGTQTGSMKVLLVHNTVYFEGDKLGLTNYLGLSSSLAPAYAGKWISFAHDNQGFATIAASLTIKAAISQISLGGPLSIAAGQAGEGATLLLRGTSGALSTDDKRAPATLVVTTTSPPLPGDVHRPGQGRHIDLHRERDLQRLGRDRARDPPGPRRSQHLGGYELSDPVRRSTRRNGPGHRVTGGQ